MTAPSRPSRTSRLPTATSPWNHTGSRSHVVRIASSHDALDRVARDLGAERVDRFERLLRRMCASGPPR